VVLLVVDLVVVGMHEVEAVLLLGVKEILLRKSVVVEGID
jgi:hypothetical protein